MYIRVLYIMHCSQEKKVLAAQNIAMQCFVKLCTKFGDTLVVSYYNFVGNIQAHISFMCTCAT